MESDNEEIELNTNYISSLEKYIKALDKMTINELINYKVEPIKNIQKLFLDWYNKFNKDNEINLNFKYSDELNYLLPRDLLIIELREKNDLYDSYIGNYQYLLKYIKDIIDRNNSPIGKISKELNWYNKACKQLLNSKLDCLNTLTINYSWILTNNLNNEKKSGNTTFLLFYYPLGLFDSNNLLPTTVWNRLILRYPFLDNKICFIPSITKSWSNSDDFSNLVNNQFNKLLFSIISFIERKDNTNLDINLTNLDKNDIEIKDFQINSFVQLKNLKLDMKLNVFGNKINILNYNLLPSPTNYNNYYSTSLSPELFDINKFKELIDYLKRRYNDDLINYCYDKEIFDKCLESLYKPTNFNISILWWFIKNSSKSKELSNDLMFTLKDNVTRIFNPTNELEKLYYLTKIKIVCDNNLLSLEWLNEINDDDDTKYYTFNEMIHLINSLIMYKNNHFYFKYQSYSDISLDANKNKKKNSSNTNTNGTNGRENENQQNDESLKNLDDLTIIFSYCGRLYKTNLQDLYHRNYLNLDTLFSLQRSINKKLFFDQNEYVNYLYYLNGVLMNRYQNKNTLIYTIKNLLNSYDNDMKSLYIIGESQCGKSVFKNILLQYINEYYEKTSTKQSDFNYDDSSILKIYDDVDLLEKSKNRSTNLVLNKDTYTVNINEKNKQPVKVYKDITNIVLNNDWPKIITWYHQRRIKTCLFIPNSKNSLEYTVDRIFKSNTRGNGSFNDVFINNFYQYLISYNDNLYYDGIYYSDCIHLLDSNLPIDILQENVKNILNLDSVIQTKGLIRTIGEQNIVVLKQFPNINYTDYCLMNKFEIII